VIREHVDAIEAALKAAPNLTVYVGKVPDDPTTPYVVVFPSGGLSGREGLVPVSDRIDLPFQVTAVGATHREVLWAVDKSRAALVDRVLPVTGRAMFPVVHDDSAPMRRDDSIAPPLLYVVDRYSVASIPA
jgi:hypothetical protein